MVNKFLNSRARKSTIIPASGLSLEIWYYLKTNKTIHKKHMQQNYNLE